MLVRHDGLIAEALDLARTNRSILLGTEGQGGVMRALQDVQRSLEKVRWWAIGAVITFVGGFGATIITIALHR